MNGVRKMKHHAPEGVQPEFQHPFRLLLDLPDSANDVLAQWRLIHIFQ